MHELSVAHAVVSTVVDALPAEPVRVREVHVRIGALSGVVPQALQFAYEVAALDTPLQDAVLRIEQVPVSVHCPACDEDRELPATTLFRCPSCGTPTGDVRHGEELEVARIVYDEAPVPAAGGAP
ncbi:MAG: hydrogenase maturation nickel metallochaperone HypA [Candidatus Nanopelagicales bacterium]